MKIYRWCDEVGGGLVLAFSIKSAKKKLRKCYAGYGTAI